MQQIIKISAPLGLVFILSLIVVVETGLLIGGLIYYNTVSDLESAGKIVPSIYNNQKPASDF